MKTTRMRTTAVCMLMILLSIVVVSRSYAVPINPLNSRPVSVTLGDAAGTLPNGEKDLQYILDQAYPGAFDPVASQSAFGMWKSPSPLFPTMAPILVFEYAGNADTNILGVWSGTDTKTVTSVDVFNGTADPGVHATLAWQPDGSVVITQTGGDLGDVNTGTFNGINPFGLGFYLTPAGNLPRFYSLDQLNPQSSPQMLAFNLANSNDWVFAFEDVLYNNSDKDFNDAVLRVESLQGVPEPGTILLLG